LSAAASEHGCPHAWRFADGIDGIPSAQVLNDVVLNQVLVRFGDDDETTREVIAGCLPMKRRS
jgi:hypothetical protein